MIRAAMIDESTGIVENIIMATPDDFTYNPKIIPIPQIRSKDGSLTYSLGVGMKDFKWDGSKFVDLQDNEITFNEDVIKRIAEQDKLFDTEQNPPEVI